MIQDEIDLFPLQAVRVRSNGKRDYEPAVKRRLIEFCLQSGASVSGTALKAGINANQLRKWIREYRDSAQAQGALPAFVPVVEEVLDSRPIKTPAQVVVSGDPPPRRAQPLALLSAKLPNGVSLELECSERDVGLVKAMIEALSGGH
ncbi:IS66-like element accessory protein TnpA [Cupriavidus necator]|uniref:Helix-turn-helix, Fis-type n=1 Tax=Cupriavidus pinatubonensis (strain JMP 134 / LMG 1197) TaxID=264198 RepID=Q46MF5_CUPPJ|nr:transposase [Cupriavidus necator]